MQRFLFRHFTPWVGAVLLALVGAVPAARAQTVDWARVVGQSRIGWNIAQIVADAQGNTYICGQFSDSLIIGSFTLYAPDSLQVGASDVYVAKLDPNGVCLWATRAGGQGLSGGGNNLGYDSAYGLALDAAGDVFVTGIFDSYSIGFGPYTLYNAGPKYDLFVAKLSSATGQWLWAQRAGGAGGRGDGEDVGRGVQTDAAGDAYVLGSFQSAVCQVGTTALTRRTHADLLVAKLDGATGQWQWATRAALGIGRPEALTLDGRGHVFVAGSFLNPAADFGADTLSAYSAGSGTSYVENRQCFVARLSAATGAWQWATQGGDSNRQYGWVVVGDLAVSSQGNCTIVGSINGSSTMQFGATVLANNSGVNAAAPAPANTRLLGDALLVQLDSAGQWVSAASFGGIGSEGFVKLQTEPGGTLCALGGMSGQPFNLGSLQMQSLADRHFLAQLDPATNTWNAAAIIGSGIRSLAVDVQGRRYVSGIFRGASFQVGSATLTSPGPATSYTGFVARFGAGPLAAPAAHPASPAGLNVWPNPTTGTVQVSGPAPSQPIWLVDMQGRCVGKDRMPSAGSLVLELPAGLAAGLYVVRVPGTRLARRLVVE